MKAPLTKHFKKKKKPKLKFFTIPLMSNCGLRILNFKIYYYE